MGLSSDGIFSKPVFSKTKVRVPTKETCKSIRRPVLELERGHSPHTVLAKASVSASPFGLRGAAKSHYQGYGYREKGQTGAIF